MVQFPFDFFVKKKKKNNSAMVATSIDLMKLQRHNFTFLFLRLSLNDLIN